MRMVLISFIFLIIMTGVWIWFHFGSIETVTGYYEENLTDLYNLLIVENWEKADTDIEAYITKWEETRDLWIYFINQNDLDNIDITIKKLNVFIKNHEKAMAQAELEHLKVLFDVIKENECLALDNIF